MSKNTIIEKLLDASPGMEIWWDSSPLLFPVWAKKMLSEVKLFL